MIDVGTLVMKIDANTKGFQTGVKTVNKGLSSIGGAVTKAGKAVAVGTAALGAGFAFAGTKAISAGAEAEEMLNKYNVVFKGMTDTVDDWAESYSRSVGRSVFDTKEYLSNLADLQIGLGMTQDEAFGLSKNIVELGTDLASFNNLQDDEAIDALSKAMLGEAESAKKLGLLLNVDRVKAYAEAQGYVWKEVTDAQRAQLTYQLALEQSQNAIGDAERSAQSFTNQMKALKTSLSDSFTEIGMKLIPIATKMVQFVNNKIVPSLGDWIDKGVDVFENISQYLGPVIEGLMQKGQEAFPTIKKFATEAFETMKGVGNHLYNFYNDSMLPVFDRIWKWWEENGPEVSKIAGDVFNGIVTVAQDLWKYFAETLLPIFESVADYVIENWPEISKTIEEVYNGAKEFLDPLIELISDGLLGAFEDLQTFVDSDLPGIGTSLGETFGLIGSALEPIVDFLDYINEGFEKLNELMPNVDVNLRSFTTPHGLTSLALDAAGAALGGGVDASAMPSYMDPMYGGDTYNVTLTGNTIMSDREAAKIMQAGVDELKRYGAQP